MKGFDSDRGTECWCEGCWCGMIWSAACGAKPEEETALCVSECENPSPLSLCMAKKPSSLQRTKVNQQISDSIHGLVIYQQFQLCIDSYNEQQAESLPRFILDITSLRADQLLQQVLQWKNLKNDRKPSQTIQTEMLQEDIRVLKQACYFIR